MSFEDEDAAPEVSKPTVNGAVMRVIVAALVVGLVAVVVQWERGHIASPVPELPPPSAADESFQLASTAAEGGVELTWRQDPRATEYRVEVSDARGVVLATLGPVPDAHLLIVTASVPGAASGDAVACRVLALRSGELLSESAKQDVTLP